MFWDQKNVLVTGGLGFIGSHLVDAVVERGASVTVADNFQNGTLSNVSNCEHRIKVVRANLGNPAECEELCSGIDIVLNLAAKVAGVAYNSIHPAEMFAQNVLIGFNMLEAARKHDVTRFLTVSSACVYRRDAIVPTPESEGFIGDPEPSNLGYGWAKRVIEVQSRTYADEYGVRIAIVRPFNTYGPRDHFDVQYGHVIPSLIRKALEQENPIVVWGNGTQTRSFVYVTDVVAGMLIATERFAVADPVNIGSDEEITIGDLVKQIIKLTGGQKQVRFDPTKPSGQPRRAPDLTKAKENLGFRASIHLNEGLRRAIDWYHSTREL